MWLGSVAGFDRAVEMMNQLAERQPGEYFVFSSEGQTVVTVRNGHKHLIDLGVLQPNKLKKIA